MASNSVKFNIEIGGTAYTGIAQLSEAMDDLNVKVNKTQGLLGMFGEKALGLNAITDIVGKVSSALGGIAAPAMEAETQLQNLKTLYRGNAEEAKDMYDRIAQYGKDVKIYDKATLLEAQRTMTGYQIEAEKAFIALKQIGDISMGDSQKMQSLSLAFAQASSNGKLMTGDYKQMINAGFNPLLIISERTGESMASLQERMEKGEISAEMMAQAFAWATDEQGLFYNAAENAGDTAAGRLAELRNKIDDLKISLFEAAPGFFTYVTMAGELGTQIAPLLPLFQGIGSLLGGVVGVIGSISKFGILRKIVSLKTGLVGVIGKVQMLGVKMSLLKLEIGSAGGLWKFFQKMGETACKGIGHAIKTIPIVGWIAAGITLVIGIVTLLWEKCEGFRVLVMGIWEVIKTGFMAVWEFVQPIFESWWNTIMGIIEFVQSIPEKVMAIVGAIKTKVKEVYNWLKTTIFGPIIDWFKNLYKNTVKPVIDKIVGLMADLFNPLIEFWNKVSGKIVRAFKKGAAKGHESWKQDQEEKNKKEEEETAENGILPTMPVEKPKPDKKLKSGNMGKSAGTAAGSARQVNITLTSLVGTMNFSGMTRENAASIEREVTELMARVLGMAETAV